MKNIPIIPIRENSKRFPDKNFFTITNDTLYDLVAKVVLKSKVFDSVFIGVKNPELINDYCDDSDIDYKNDLDLILSRLNKGFSEAQ
tara:strand:- start:16268 stop:16528 length:261 start_codon:yes stop_codon:yes gene_type:complete